MIGKIAVSFSVFILGIGSGFVAHKSGAIGPQDETGSAVAVIEIRLEDGTTTTIEVAGTVDVRNFPGSGEVSRAALWVEESGGNAFRIEIEGPVEISTTPSDPPPPDGLVEDEFESGDISDAWSYVDPTGNGDARSVDGELAVSVVGPHDLWGAENETGRVFQSVGAAEDFDVAWELAEPSIPEGAMVGLHLDAGDSFYRAEIHTRDGAARAFFVPFDRGEAGEISSTENPGWSFLRAKRAGDSLEVYGSSDGSNWVRFGADSPALLIVELGLYSGISAGADLASYEARADRFFFVEADDSGGDGGDDPPPPPDGEFGATIERGIQRNVDAIPAPLKDLLSSRGYWEDQ